MHDIEPYYKWRDYYAAENDERTPFYGRTYSEFQFTQKIYNYFIHPQWDFYGSQTMCMKLLFVDYTNGVVLIELLGEWNDCITNDIMILKREIIDQLIVNGIRKFVMFCDNVLNFHGDGDDYYEEWYDDVADEDGWICFVNLNEHVQDEMQAARIQNYVRLGEDYNDINWRASRPQVVIKELENRNELI